MSKEQRSVWEKLLIIFVFYGILIISLVVSSIFVLDKTEKNTRVIQEKSYVQIALLNELRFDVIQVQQWLTDISATRGVPGFDDGYSEAKTYAENFRRDMKKLNELSKDNQKLVKLQKEILISFESYYDMGKKMAQAYIDNGHVEGNKFMEKFDPFAAKIADLLKEQRKEILGNVENNFKNLFLSMKQSSFIFKVTATIFIILITVITFFIASSIGKITNNLKMSIKDLEGMSKKVNDRNNALAARTEEQAATSEEIVGTIDALANTIEETANNSKKSNSLSESTLQGVKKGNSISIKLKDSMGLIANSSKEIQKIVSLVEEIAFQTNILSTNAAIEAAKAGDSGKGFAVVAIEVRNLAKRSSQAVSEIKLLVDKTYERVKNGETLVEQNAVELKGVNDQVEKVAQIVNEITQATNKQIMAVNDISGAITEIDANTQENSALVVDITSSSQSMYDSSVQISKAIDSLKK